MMQPYAPNQIHLTDEQDRLIAARASDAGVSKAEVIRGILDEELRLDGRERRRRAIEATAGLLPDAEDWDAWLASVRGARGDERLHRVERRDPALTSLTTSSPRRPKRPGPRW